MPPQRPRGQCQILTGSGISKPPRKARSGSAPLLTPPLASKPFASGVSTPPRRAPRSSTPILTAPAVATQSPLSGVTGDKQQARGRTSLLPANTLPSDLRTSRAPIFASLEHLRCHFSASLRDAATAPPAPATDFEVADCRGAPYWLLDARGDNEQRSVLDHAALFDSQVEPAVLSQRTRNSYYSNWRAYMTYAHIQGCLTDAIPAKPYVLRGYLWFLLQAGYKPGSITLRVYSIVDRHVSYGLPFPYHQKVIKRWIKAFERLCGVPRRDKLAITATHLKTVLLAPRRSLREIRDTAIVALGTVCALRVSELIELDVCDLLFDFEPGVLAVRVKKRKNDQKRAGLWPRLAHATNPAFDIIVLLRTWLSRAGLDVSTTCEKTRHPRSQCRSCGRLFSRIMGCGAQVFPVGHRMHGATANTVRDAVHSTLERADYNTQEFSSISMRRGGLTTALAEGVPSDLYELQSGHASNAWKSYVRPGQHDKLLMFYHAFKL